MLFCLLPGPFRLTTADYKKLFGGGKECPHFHGPPRPKGAVIPPTAEKDPGRDQQDQAAVGKPVIPSKTTHHYPGTEETPGGMAGVPTPDSIV